MKWFFLLALFCVLPLLVHGTAIQNYAVSPNVHLGENVVATGDFNGTISAGVLCSAYIWDLNNSNSPLMRLSDEYTDPTGRFWFQQIVSEPTFYRGFDYNFVVSCATISVNQSFHIDQPRDPSLIPIATMIYLKDNATLIIWGILVAVFILAVLGLLSYFSKHK